MENIRIQTEIYSQKEWHRTKESYYQESRRNAPEENLQSEKAD